MSVAATRVSFSRSLAYVPPTHVRRWAFAMVRGSDAGCGAYMRDNDGTRSRHRLFRAPCGNSSKKRGIGRELAENTRDMINYYTKHQKMA